MRLGLRGHALSFCITLVLMTATTVGSVLIWQHQGDSFRAMQHQAIVFAQAVGRSAEPALLLNDRKALEHVLEVAIAHPEATRAALYNAAGNPLATRVAEKSRRTGSDAAPRIATTRPHETVPVQRPLEVPTVKTTARIQPGAIEVLVPIWQVKRALSLELLELDQQSQPAASERPIGYLKLELALAGLHAQRAASVLSGALLTVLVSSVAIVMIVIAVQQMLNPLRDLADAAHTLAKGDLTRRAPARGVGEIGVLARTFNEMADQLERSYQSIEHTVRERTLELEQRTAELERARIRAEAASRAKSDFLANMSHEIRTPMTAILGYAEVLGDPGQSDEQRALAVQTIRSNAGLLLGIINDILDLSKIEAGRLELEKITTCPTRLLYEVESLMRVRAQSKGLTLRLEFDSDMPTEVLTDPTRLRQVLLNLVGNAVKFTESGEVTIRARLIDGLPAEKGGGPLLRIDVCDTGVGIPPDLGAKLFQPFTQADETMTRRFGGTGLGLSISKRLVTMLGGELTFTSEPGKGSVFTVELPVRAPGGLRTIDPRRLPPPAKAFPAESTIDSQALAGCRVLLAEDGVDNQRLIRHFLTQVGAEVVIAPNGEEAVRRALEASGGGGAFDVILMDMQMPVMDGYEATRTLRRETYSGPIIALTAHAMAGARERCIEAGCSDYATKPIDRERLIQLVRRYRSHATAAAG